MRQVQISERALYLPRRPVKAGKPKTELSSAPPKVHESLQRQEDSSKMLAEKIKYIFYPYLRNYVFWNTIH